MEQRVLSSVSKISLMYGLGRPAYYFKIIHTSIYRIEVSKFYYIDSMLSMLTYDCCAIYANHAVMVWYNCDQ